MTSPVHRNSRRRHLRGYSPGYEYDEEDLTQVDHGHVLVGLCRIFVAALLSCNLIDYLLPKSMAGPWAIASSLGDIQGQTGTGDF